MCDQSQLPFYVSGQLSPAERLRIEAHLNECHACTTAVEQWQTVRTAIQLRHQRRLQPLPALQIPLPEKTRPIFPKTALLAAALVLAMLVGFAQIRRTGFALYAEPSAVPTVIPTVVHPTRFIASDYSWVPQTWNNQGPANLAQVLGHFGYTTSQEEIARVLKSSPDDKNVSPLELVYFVTGHTQLRAIARVGEDLTLVKKLIYLGYGVILEVGMEVPNEGWFGHYITVIGYDDKQSLLYTLDTYLGPGVDQLGYPRGINELDQYWQNFNRTLIIVYPKSKEAELARLLGTDADVASNAQHALSIARSEVAKNPANPFAWFNVGSSCMLLQQSNEAVVAFDQAWRVGKLPSRILWYQFTPYEAYFNTGNYAQVLVLTRAALQTSNMLEESYYWQALAENKLGQTSKAFHDLHQALKLNPNLEVAAQALSVLEEQFPDF